MIQLKYSDSIAMHGERLKNRYGFTDYVDTTKPTLFYGFFFGRDWKAVLNHKGKRACLWSGSDALGKERVKLLTQQKDILHLVSSKWVENDLKWCTNNYVVVPRINSSLEHWKPCPLGKRIYWANSLEPKYGSQYRDALIEEFGHDTFIFSNAHGDFSNTTHTFKDMYDVYEKCFVGLRLTERDGCPQTVMEMGLMGRPVIWNGDSPNACNYESIEDIVRTIRDAQTAREWHWKELGMDMANYLSIDLQKVIEDYFEGKLERVEKQRFQWVKQVV